MISLHFDLSSFVTMALCIITMFLGLSAVISLTPDYFKKTLLSFDKDGAHLIFLSLLCILIGVVVPDYTSAYVACGVGFFFLVLGAWIALPDKLVNKELGKELSYFYILGSLVIFAAYSLVTNQGIFYNVYGLTNLIIPTVIVALLVTSAFVSLTSRRFKDRILPQDLDGGWLVWAGIIILLFAPFAGVCTPLMITTTVLGCGLISFGGLVALKDDITSRLLNPKLVVLELPIAVALLYYARLWY